MPTRKPARTERPKSSLASAFSKDESLENRMWAFHFLENFPFDFSSKLESTLAILERYELY